MKRFCALLCAVLLVVALGVGPAVATAADSHEGTIAGSAVVTPLATDDEIPGDPLPSSPVADSLTGVTDQDDVFSFSLQAGDEVTFVLPEPPGGRDFDLALYGPGATSIADPILTTLDTGWYPEALGWTAATSGT